jgi:uncharacterized membrane protein
VTAVIVVVAVVLVAVIGAIAYFRRPRHDAGVASFRRHIEALSPESRREVQDRVRPASDDDPEPEEPAD